MEFRPFVILAATGVEMPVQIVPAQDDDCQVTRGSPAWQIDWRSEFLAEPTVEKYAVKAADGELIALGAYQIRGHSAYVYIIYAESAPPSNPTITAKESRKYYGIGGFLIAYGSKYSIDNGCRGDVVFDAKTMARWNKSFPAILTVQFFGHPCTPFFLFYHGGTGSHLFDAYLRLGFFSQGNKKRLCNVGLQDAQLPGAELLYGPHSGDGDLRRLRPPLQQAEAACPC